MNNRGYYKYMLLLIGGMILFFLIGRGVHSVFNAKSVAIRVGMARENVNYDMQVALKFLIYQLKQKGYRVAGVSYAGQLYPKELDNVGMNVFVRGENEPLFDVRFDKNAQNVLFLHRTNAFYLEELRNYDLYITTQKQIFTKFQPYDKKELLVAGAVPHPTLKNEKYAYDLLYIYEGELGRFDEALRKYPLHKIYKSVDFALLTEEQQQQELAQARFIIYDEAHYANEDADYVPYAMYDIVGYGRTLLLRPSKKLEKIFGNKAYLTNFE